ncbi:MAG: histidinol-phosphatase [Gammaproteobacteria bacterium]|nr:histidinol-phosphatase [Gammaproteobacteria bacterium]
MSASARDAYLAFAIELSERAGETILPHFRPAAIDIENKVREGYDPVTQADRAAEQAMRHRIAEQFPDHGVLGEEFGFLEGAGLTWVLDPIDGTRAFVMGLLHWGTLVALFDGQRPRIGVLRQPFSRETFAGDCEHASRSCDGAKQRLVTRRCASLEEALCASTSPEMFSSAEESARFSHVQGLVRDMRYGTDCYAYAMLAAGHIDLIIEASLQPYDVQALIPIVEGAGGVLTTWEGENASMGGAIVASGDPKLHEQVLKELQS